MTTVLLAGESWTMHTIHQKGFDSFTTTAYAEGHEWLSSALKAGGFELDYLPSHLANDQFPLTPEELAKYDAVILSDIGSNTLLLPSATFTKSVVVPNRLESIRQYVENGGGFVMVGGYLTFQGIDGKANYGGSPAETVGKTSGEVQRKLKMILKDDTGGRVEERSVKIEPGQKIVVTW